ncbi:MAG TPA: nucleotidyltransferase family protein [Candidatus Sulfomarinibacteraceae bacterium]|nr:nucleotidyltransferase family protein [Candidatus Sulfomarinibacteraceae bacterium]
MDCIVAAGGTLAPDDPLYPYTKGKPKSLLQLGQQTMLEHIVAALRGSRYVDDIIVVGLDRDQAPPSLLELTRPPIFLGEQGKLLQNMRSGFEWVAANHPEARTVLLSTSDIPLLNASIVDNFVDACRPFDRLAYYNVVTRETMEKRFPNSNRTFVRLKGLSVAGGDLMLAKTRVIHSNPELWQALIDGRKQAWKLARIVGLWTVFKLLIGQLSLAEVESKASKLVGEPVRILNSPYPELAMDVDKPAQVEALHYALSAAAPQS